MIRYFITDTSNDADQNSVYTDENGGRIYTQYSPNGKDVSYISPALIVSQYHWYEVPADDAGLVRRVRNFGYPLDLIPPAPPKHLTTGESLDAFWSKAK